MPPGSPMTAAQQRAVEAELAVSNRHSTPIRVDRRYRALAFLVLTGLVLTEMSCAKPLILSACLVGINAVVHIAAPRPWIQMWSASGWRWPTLVVFGLITQLEMTSRYGWPPGGSFLQLLGGSAILWGLVMTVLIGFDASKAHRAVDPRRNTRRVRKAMLAHGRCPSCAHTVTRFQNGRSKAWLCPHCSGYWGDADFKTPESCPRCGYLLAGLAPSGDGSIRCPECAMTLPAAAPRPRAPLPQSSVQPPRELSPACWNCKRSLRGLPLVLGDRVQCPECGQWRSGLTEADVRPSDATVP